MTETDSVCTICGGGIAIFGDQTRVQRPPTKERRRSSAGAIKEETSGHYSPQPLEETMRPLKKSAASKDPDN